MQPALRRTWLRLHRWVALTMGGLLVIAGFLGALLTIAKPLDQWTHAGLFRDPAAAGAPDLSRPSLDRARRHLEQAFGPAAGYTFRPPRGPNDSLWVYVSGPWDGVVYFDSLGRELGRRGETEGAYNLLYELHSSLLLGDAGKAVLTAAAGSYLLLLGSGLVLWWPRRWPPSFRIHCRAGALRSLLELHNTTGPLLGLLVAVSIASGAYMAWPPLRALVGTESGRPATLPPKPAVHTAARPSSLDRMVLQARALFPVAMVGYVQVPADPARPVRVRLKLADDPHPNGLTSVWFDAGTGQVLRAVRWSELDRGNRLVSVIYPLHTGALGGPLHQLVVGLTGLALATLGGSGLLLWWQRRHARVRPGGGRRAAGERGRP